MSGKKEKEELPKKAYVEKANLSNVHVWPIPENLDDWIEIDFDPEFNYINKVYNVDSGEFEENKKAINEVALIQRKKAYAERSDPLFIEWQYDKTEEAETKWRNEVQAIKSEFPLN